MCSSDLARAAPVFREVAMGALRMLDVPKDLPDRELLTKSPKKVESDLSAAGANDAFVTMAAAKAAAQETSPGFAYGDEPVRSQKMTARGVDSARPSELVRGANASGMRVVSSVTQPLARGGTPASAGDSSTGQRPFLSTEGQPSGALVPDFRGKTQRAVMQESTAKGLDVELFGSGLASRQDPPPGAAVRPGVAVKVQFGR